MGLLREHIETSMLNKRMQTSPRVRLPLWLTVVLLALALFANIPPAHAQSAPEALAAISPHLAAELETATEPVPVLVLLKAQLDPATLVDPAAPLHARTAALYAALTRHAESTQAPLLAWLDAQGVAYTRHYIVNMVSVRGDAALVAQLQRRPEVARLLPNPTVNALAVTQAPAALRWDVRLRPAAAPDTALALYGLDAIGAPELWTRDIRGQGIVLANQDTGVEWTHPALQDTYRGWDGIAADHDYNWFDAWAGLSDSDPCRAIDGPCDDNGHGTHTVGTLVGTRVDDTGTLVLGAAPDAAWMGCRNMLRGFGTPESYIACFEFFLAPYPVGGDPFRDGRPELAPHIISNSWGCPPYEGCDPQSLAAAVETAHAAGQLVVAAAGNSGPICSSVRDPIAIYGDTLTVGSHDSGGNIAFSSSRGPVTIDGSNRLKPDLVAPGVGIFSTYRGGGYATLSGTSMATPHVAGGAALLWSAFPDLVGRPDLTTQLLIKSATPIPSMSCTGGDVAVHPNPVAGYGRMDLVAAYGMAQQPWRVAVRVTDLHDRPLAGVEVAWLDAETGYRVTVITDYTGVGRVPVVWHGHYSLTATLENETVGQMGIVLHAELDDVSGTQDGATLRLHYAATRETPPVYTMYVPGVFGP